LFKTVTTYVRKLLGAFPIKRGENDLKAMKTAINIVRTGNILGLFPEGTRNKDGHDIDIKAGIGFIVAKTKVPVIPVSIYGRTRLFSKIKIIIGEPIDFSKYFQEKISSNDYKEISNMIMSKIRGSYQLSENSFLK
jgi:1-acyl-sn-glycerol-3-phosphate acyltransferase